MSRTSPVRLLALVLGCSALLTVLTIAFIDGPDPSHAFRHVISVHDSMIPTHTVGGAPTDGPPRLEGELAASESGMAFATWMFRWRGRWVSVHRVESSLTLPPQSRVLSPADPQRSTFEAGDLSLVSWEDGARTWVVAGSDDARQLLRLADRVVDGGIEALLEARSAPSRAPTEPAPTPK